MLRKMTTAADEKHSSLLQAATAEDCPTAAGIL